jgi:hypothetical protein
MFKVQGTLKVKGDTVQVSDKFSKREFVLSIQDGNYEQLVSFQLSQKNVTLLDGVKEGDECEISFGLKGREWVSPKDGEVKYFNTLDAFRVEATVSADAPPF